MFFPCALCSCSLWERARGRSAANSWDCPAIPQTPVSEPAGLEPKWVRIIIEPKWIRAILEPKWFSIHISASINISISASISINASTSASTNISIRNGINTSSDASTSISTRIGISTSSYISISNGACTSRILSHTIFGSVQCWLKVLGRSKGGLGSNRFGSIRWVAVNGVSGPITLGSRHVGPMPFCFNRFSVQGHVGSMCWINPL